MGKAVIYFDGVCNLCNRLVDFVIRRDRGRRYRFASLQGQTARERLPKELTGPTPGTIVLEQGDQLRFRSDAVLEILAGLWGVWRLAGVFRAVPRPIRDRLYEWVSRNRLRWFGRRETCRIPSAGEREVFLP